MLFPVRCTEAIMTLRPPNVHLTQNEWYQGNVTSSEKNEGMIFTEVFVLRRHYSVTVVWIFWAVVDGKEAKEDFQQETKNPWRLLWKKCQNEHLKTDGENWAANERGRSWSLRFFFCMWTSLSIGADIKGFPRRCRKFWKRTNVCTLSRKTSTCLRLHRKPESKASVCCSSGVSVASLAFCMLSMSWRL